MKKEKKTQTGRTTNRSEIALKEHQEKQINKSNKQNLRQRK